MIVPGVIGRFEVLETLQNAQRFGREFTQILIGPQCKEGAVGGSVFTVGIVVPAAAGFAEVFQPLQQRFAQALGHAVAVDSAPAAG